MAKQNKKTVTLNEIDNGWLMATPPEQSVVQIRGQEQQVQGQPTIFFAGSYDELCVLLKQFFPPQ